MTQDIKVGDRIRVTYEATVTDSPGDGTLWGDSHGGARLVYPGLDTVEVLPPPVVQFQPGDVVRDRRQPERLFALGTEGYTHLTDYDGYRAGAYGRYGSLLHAGRDWFTSQAFEKVEL